MAHIGLDGTFDCRIRSRAYGPDTGDMSRRASAYVDRILKGERPGNLPVQTPIRFELVVNLKTAKALGLSVRESFLGLCDEVIE